MRPGQPAAAGAAPRRHGPADLVIHSGTVVTLDRESTTAEALAVRDGRVLAVGSSADMRDLAGPGTRQVDLAGGSVMPGVNDSHLHLSWHALARPERSLDLSAVTTLAQARRLVAERAAALPADAWLLGRGWSAPRLRGAGPDGPTRADLDDVCGGRPVLLEHFSSHAAWVSSEALRRAGITAATPDPEGGRVVRDPGTGEPTGLLAETAIELVHAAVPAVPEAQLRDLMALALSDLNARGVTSLTDPVVGAGLLRDYVALREAGRLTARVTVLHHWSWPSVRTTLAQLEDAVRLVGAVTGFGDDLLRIGGCKLFADGVAALETAWMRTAYPSGHCGSLVTEGRTDAEREANLRAQVVLLHRHRFQVQVHATGDRACDAVVAAFDEAMTVDPWPRARHVLIHANLPSPGAIAALARHGLVANTNLLIKRQSAAAVRPKLDERLWHAMMPVGSMMAAGVVVADASDAPITDPDWRVAVQMLESRYVPDLDLVLGPEERVTREQALRAWTSNPAYQDHQEHAKGSIEPGKLADLVVLDRDVLAVPVADLTAVRPVLTLLGGRVVHEA